MKFQTSNNCTSNRGCIMYTSIIYIIVKMKTQIINLFNESSNRNKILPPKALLERLPMLLTQIHAGNTSTILLNEIWQIVYLLYQALQISTKYLKLNYVCENEDEQNIHELRKQREFFPISSSAECHRQNGSKKSCIIKP